MTSPQIKNMTPGAAADCFLPGCIGVSGGVCAGQSVASLNETLWWCCTPYEPCRGGAQLACKYKDGPGSQVVDEQIACTFGGPSNYTWCCSSAYETCPSSNGIEGSCIPKEFTNPALLGPIWGPDAIKNTTSSVTPITSSSVSPPPPSPTKDSQPSASTTAIATSSSSGISAGAAGAVGAVSVLAFVVIAHAIFFLWKRNKRQKKAAEELPSGFDNKPYYHLQEVAMESEHPVVARPRHELQGQGLHELESLEGQK